MRSAAGAANAVIGDVLGDQVPAGSIDTASLTITARVRADYEQQVRDGSRPTSCGGATSSWRSWPSSVRIGRPMAGIGGGGRAQAWSGKSALLAWFVLHPPKGVRIVSFFITAGWASQNNRAAFIDNLLEQLLVLLGRPMPTWLTDSTREAHLLGLLEDAAETCQARGERFVLVLDGLDEDRGSDQGPARHSIAGLLPKQLPTGMRVITAGRADPPLPDDVPPDHPLRDLRVGHELTPSPFAQDLRGDMLRELAVLLDGPKLGQDVLGFLVASGGGLSAQDFAELTDAPPRQVESLLKTVAGRSFTSRPSLYRPGRAPSIYLLAQ